MGKLSYNDKLFNADVVESLPLPCLRRTAEPVRSTRLQTFLTVLNFHSCQGNWNDGFRTKSLLTKCLHGTIVALLSQRGRAILRICQ